MKLYNSRLASAAAGFIVTATIGFASPAFAEDPGQADPNSRFQTDIEQQIQAGQREPVLTRMTGAKSLENLDKAQDTASITSRGQAMVMTLNDRISNHTEVISLRQDLGNEIQNRFQEDVILNQRINNLLGTVSGQNQAIQLNRNMIGASQSDLNRIERRANDAYSLGDDAMDRANQAYNLANTANGAAGSAYSLANSAYTLAQKALDRPAGSNGGANEISFKNETYIYTTRTNLSYRFCTGTERKDDCHNGRFVTKYYQKWNEGVFKVGRASGQVVSCAEQSRKQIDARVNEWSTYRRQGVYSTNTYSNVPTYCQ